MKSRILVILTIVTVVAVTVVTARQICPNAKSDCQISCQRDGICALSAKPGCNKDKDKGCNKEKEKDKECDKDKEKDKDCDKDRDRDRDRDPNS